jgi:hypothetical protein
MTTGLYGIIHSNRDTEAHWGKNCFNSSFPTAMACYMLDKGIPAIYNKLEIVDGMPAVVSTEIAFDKVFNSGNRSFDELDFRFEAVYEPYQDYSFDAVGGIDLVVCGTDRGFLSPLEVKLTVMPTSSTSLLPENHWGCELVVRSATTSYCAIGMFDAISNDAAMVRDIFETPCSSIQSWDNDFEMTHKTPDLSKCLDAFELKYLALQKPLLMQAIWKTDGQSPILADNAFDIVIWSDFAFTRLFIDSSYSVENTMSRPMRASARLARCLWELSKSGKIRLQDIYRQMAFGNQTDKEFAIQGSKWRSYISSPRIPGLRLPKGVVNEIIAPGYIEKLRPERRFDQTLYFTARGNL